MQVRWLGGLLDEVLILFVFCLLARVIEYRLKKRGSHFAFSLAELLFSICVACVFLTWFITEYQRAKKENAVADRLFAVFDADQETTELLSPMKPVFD